jgi:3-methyladenine DNA glycosylase AlkD
MSGSVQDALAWLEEKATQRDLDNMTRFGIVTEDRVIGVSMSNIQAIAKRLGRGHALAAELWDTRCYEARTLTAFVDEPEQVTPTQMDRWCADFDNWGICDTLCFKLFDRTPHAWAKVAQWKNKRGEFQKRAAFALLASLAGHDKTSGDEPFLQSLEWIDQAATDDRNFVRKGVSWALRRIGTRGPRLLDASLELAGRLAAMPDPTARWIGKDALRDLQKRAGAASETHRKRKS